MANSVLLEVVTPSKLFYMGEIEMVIARPTTGYEGFMVNHTWACKLLSTGKLMIKEKGASEFKLAAISGGFIDIKDQFIIYTDAAEWAEDIDIDRSRSVMEQAENWLKSHSPDEDSEKNILKAKLTMSKATNRMKVAEEGIKNPR
jgi:F-type H+-transporting ATPase subunit epsilon